MRAALIHNPTAGSGNVAAEELTETLKKAGFDTHYFSSKDDDYKHCLSIVDDAEIVIVAGGDGAGANDCRTHLR